MPARFQFKPVTPEDRPMIHQGLAQDYIREWIHGEGLESTLSGLDIFIERYKQTQTISRNDTFTQHWIGFEGDIPMVYLLTSNVFADEDSIYAKHKSAEGHAITLDIFITNPDYLGRGLATQIITAFLQAHFSGITEVFIDPEKGNKRAVHVYQKLGFEIIDEFVAPWHPVPHWLMRLDMSQLG